MSTWWLSFVDDKADKFLGVIVIDAESFENAVCGAWNKGINPGGEVAGMHLPDEARAVVPPDYLDRLLTKAEAQTLDGIFSRHLPPSPDTLQ